MKAYHGFKQIPVDSKIYEVFTALFPEFDITNETDRLIFNKET
jgi:hypothetical protein